MVGLSTVEWIHDIAYLPFPGQTLGGCFSGLCSLPRICTVQLLNKPAGVSKMCLSLGCLDYSQRLIPDSYGHLLVITGYFHGIIHSMNGVSSVLITSYNWYNSGHNYMNHMFHGWIMSFIDHPSFYAPILTSTPPGPGPGVIHPAQKLRPTPSGGFPKIQNQNPWMIWMGNPKKNNWSSLIHCSFLCGSFPKNRGDLTWCFPVTWCVGPSDDYGVWMCMVISNRRLWWVKINRPMSSLCQK